MNEELKQTIEALEIAKNLIKDIEKIFKVLEGYNAGFCIKHYQVDGKESYAVNALKEIAEIFNIKLTYHKQPQGDLKND